MPIRTLSKELIAEIQGSIRHLTTLNLSNNEISQIQNLEPLASLTKLDLGRNRIGAIGGLDALRELAHLDLSGNRIEAVGGLDRLGALEVLVLADNRIGRFEALRTLAWLPQLHTLTLRGNPLASRANYREQVARWLPALALSPLPLCRACPSSCHPLPSHVWR